MWEAFTNLITYILTSIHGLCGDWGLAIIILTLIVRLLIMPLMTKSTKSSAKMQVLQPQMQAIQERYADDPQRMQEEMRKFYSENKFNPMGGCLPILLQMPIFFALFSVIRNVEVIATARLPSSTSSPTAPMVRRKPSLSPASLAPWCTFSLMCFLACSRLFPCFLTRRSPPIPRSCARARSWAW